MVELLKHSFLLQMLKTMKVLEKSFFQEHTPTVFARFVARALIFFNQTHYRALIQARALVIFKVKLCTKIIVEDKYFTTLIFFPCQFIHVKRKLFTSKE